ncbi:amidase domain-containing protein [Clostridium sp. SYSU_GA19001]|uniref:amidase domain-containing protein n=1 Tax=Clostridium caldaquaticum TaxID=2940653 RepID=UPI0020770AEF|nr:amidase domain-containing protein [Clostridium caldaquaticum]MCM8711149.1 amidase domain-containing protein [Clostridium caldaquaticum]
MEYYGNFYKVNGYNGENAVRYALTYALNPNPEYKYFSSHGEGGGNCSNFVSQCLKAGGAPFAYDSSPWWYKGNTWSVSWAVAHALYWTLKVRAKKKMKGLKAFEVPSIESLSLGDLIQYEDYKEIIYHSAIVTAFTIDRGIKVPLISQNTYNARNISYIKPKAKKTHFMKIVVS